MLLFLFNWFLFTQVSSDFNYSNKVYFEKVITTIIHDSNLPEVKNQILGEGGIFFHVNSQNKIVGDLLVRHFRFTEPTETIYRQKIYKETEEKIFYSLIPDSKGSSFESYFLSYDKIKQKNTIIFQSFGFVETVFLFDERFLILYTRNGLHELHGIYIPKNKVYEIYFYSSSFAVNTQCDTELKSCKKVAHRNSYHPLGCSEDNYNAGLCSHEAVHDINMMGLIPLEWKISTKNNSQKMMYYQANHDNSTTVKFFDKRDLWLDLESFKMSVKTGVPHFMLGDKMFRAKGKSSFEPAF